MFYAQVFNDVLVQFVGFGDAASFEAYKSNNPECIFIQSQEWGSPLTHWVVDGKVVAVPAAPTPTARWVPVERAYIDTYGLAAARADALVAMNAGYSRAVALLAQGYPTAERESWPVQTSEARALLSDASAPAPWLSAAAAARGLDVLELARRVVVLDDAFRSRHGKLSGWRQRLEGQIAAATTPAAALAVVWTEPAIDPAVPT